MPFDQLTNEDIKENFDSDNQFELVAYLIEHTKGMIHSGRIPRLHINTENPAVISVAEFATGKDLLDPSEDRFHSEMNKEEVVVNDTEISEEAEG